MYPPACAGLGALELTILRGEMTTPARERVQRYRRHLSDEKRQYDSERRRRARQQQSESLRSLTAREQDRQRTARHRSRETTQQM